MPYIYPRTTTEKGSDCYDKIFPTVARLLQLPFQFVELWYISQSVTTCTQCIDIIFIILNHFPSCLGCCIRLLVFFTYFQLSIDFQFHDLFLNLKTKKNYKLQSLFGLYVYIYQQVTIFFDTKLYFVLGTVIKY